MLYDHIILSSKSIDGIEPCFDTIVEFYIGAEFLEDLAIERSI